MSTSPTGKLSAAAAVGAIVVGAAFGLWYFTRPAVDEPVTPAVTEILGPLARILPVGRTGSEPTIGVTRDGSMFLTGGDSRVWKSNDRGVSWNDVSDRSRATTDQDPYLWVDPDTDRIYSAPLAFGCTNLLWSDNRGRSWEWNPAGGCGLPGHDHQSLVTGPPPRGVPTLGYPNMVYYVFGSFTEGGVWLSSSADGGRTWGTSSTRVFPPDCQGGMAGAPAVAPDGTIYVPKPGCDGLRIAVSKDAGKTWEIHDLNDVGMDGGDTVNVPVSTPYSANPGMAVDRGGNAFAAWAGEDALMYVARSSNAGRDWSAPVRVTPGGINGTAFSAVVAGDSGRIAVAYLGTNASNNWTQGKSAQFAPDGVRWHLYVAISVNALAETPTFTTIRVTPESDPVQIGCIWQSGGASECRNLRDFLDVTEQGGRVYVAFTDGCKACKDASESRRADLAVAVLDIGPSLRIQPFGRY